MRKQRREGESDYEDPSEDSLIKKAAKLEFGNPVVDALLRVILMLGMSGGAGYVTSENKSAELEHLKSEVSRLEAESKTKWRSYYDRRREAQEDHVCYERRFSRLEVRARIEAPSCVAHGTAEAPAPAEARN